MLTGSEVLGRVATLITALGFETGLIKNPKMSLNDVVGNPERNKAAKGSVPAVFGHASMHGLVHLVPLHKCKVGMGLRHMQTLQRQPLFVGP